MLIRFIPSLRCSRTSRHKPACVNISTPARCFSTTKFTLSKDYYTILGVPKNATSSEIKTAYYDKAKAYHPDANPSKETVTKFQEVSEAYEVLGDEQKRRVYDSTTRRHMTVHDVYGRARDKDGPFRPKSGPAEPISMRHISHVYKALNKVENEEQPVFIPFADHNWPNSEYNRFEYNRFWDKDLKRWVYIKKPTAKSYEKLVKTKHRDFVTVISVIVAVVVLSNLYRMSTSFSPKSEPTEEDKFRSRITLITYEIDQEQKGAQNDFKTTNTFD